MSWNCRGLGRTQDLTVQRLREFRRLFFPEILFLMETKNCRDVLVDLKVWLGYDRVYTVNPIGLSGGLAVFWKSTVKVDVKYADKNIIDLKVLYGDFSFFLSCIYREPAHDGKSIVWERLSRIGVCRKEPWCLVGDFNEILNNGEKLGGPAQSDASFRPFGDMLKACGMEELEAMGDRFTWSGKRWNKWIQCCLDRAFGNKEWLRLFPGSNQKFLDKRGSDHRPVLISLQASQSQYKGQFRFDKKFLFAPLVKEKIIDSWNSGGAGSLNRNVAKRLRDCRGVLSRWKKSRVFNARDRIHLLERRLELFESRNFSCYHAIKIIKKELYKAYREEELFWQQRSRERWLKHGDRNSKFFHASVKTNRSRKLLSKIKDADGIFQWSDAAKAQVALDYFAVLFKSSNPPHLMNLFQGLAPRVSMAMNEKLLAEVTDDEIKEAIFSIKASSAPGPDGMNGLFFHHYWDTVGPKICSEVKNFFNSGVMPDDWNFTHICLIPKIAEPELMSDLRPISLCSVMYKTISKVMVRRLQPILPEIVSFNQSAFVAERLITENVGVAHEAVHALGGHEVVEKEFMVVKSDMSKAYDRVEWSYLKGLLEALGFDRRWVGLVMACVSSVSFAVLINDQPFGLIKPQRGIRQGDPLSPFLFVLCTEGLTHMLNKAEKEAQISGLCFSENGPSIHHLLFADDSLFMCKATEMQARTLKGILVEYGEVTGQVINAQKSAISFGRKVEQDVREAISQVLGIFNEGGTSKYLGLPECLKGSKVNIFGFLNDRISGRLDAWYLRQLSQGGKEILLKASASSLPVFAMSCYKIPKTVCNKMVAAMADFWWGSDSHKRKIHWIAWDRLCLPKDLGGMGFRDLEAFNQALLSKQAWKVLTAPHCILAQLLKSRYFSEVDFLEATLGTRPSYGWRSLLFGRDLLVKGLQKRVGDGNSINVWVDKWFEDDRDGYGLRVPWIKNCTFDLNLKVRSLIDFQARRWSRAALEEIFVPSDIEVLMRQQPVVTKEDFWCWKYNKSGAYTVKSGYWLASREKNSELRLIAEALPSINVLKAACWKVHSSPKIKTFLWKAISEALPVAERLISRGMKCDDRCQLCGIEGESVNHVLFQCDMARQTWALAMIPTPPRGWVERSLFENFAFLLKISKNVSLNINITRCWPWILWFLWKHRNGFLFEGTRFHPEAICRKVTEEAEDWFSAQQIESRLEAQVVQPTVIRDQFIAPPKGWVICEFEMDWSRGNSTLGAAWIVKNDDGRVLHHSRRAFFSTPTRMEAKVVVFLWAVESMQSMRYQRVVFTSSFVDLVDAVVRPDAWPSLKFEGEEIRKELQSVGNWNVKLQPSDSGRCVSFIAQSVANLGLSQSYVATGHPRWLDKFFDNERNISAQ